MNWNDYDFPERFQDRASALGIRLGAYNNSNGSDDFDEWVEVETQDRVYEVKVSTQAAPDLGVVVIWGEATFQDGGGPGLGVRPFAVSGAEDERLWRQRLGNYLVEESKALLARQPAPRRLHICSSADEPCVEPGHDLCGIHNPPQPESCILCLAHVRGE